MITKLYPNGKTKAFNVTYDDGVLQDIRFVELLNKYNLKGTFNLNSGLIDNEFEWAHESGCIVKRLSKVYHCRRWYCMPRHNRESEIVYGMK